MYARHVLAVTLTLFMLLAAVVPASASVEVIHSESWIDQSGGGWNWCTNEWVEISGSVHFVETVVVHETGAYTLQSHMNARWTGVGTETGAKYLYLPVGNEHETVDFDDAPYTLTGIYHYQTITPGPANNEAFWTSYHITINADGTVTVEFDNFGWECR